MDSRERLLNGHVLSSVSGRGLVVVAGRDVAPNEVVFASEPCAFVLESELVALRCNFCFEGGDLKRCARCHTAHYCSKECQTTAWKAHHKHECALQAELATLPDAVRDQAALACRTILATAPDHRALVEAMFVPVIIDERFAMLAAFIRQTLGERAPDWQAPRIARLLAQGECNNFSIFSDLLVSQGAGVYPLGALLNHSCVANCATMYEPRTHRQLVRCIAPVHKGEELCHSYIDVAGTRAMRQAQLARYHFLCNCSRCGDESFDASQTGMRAVPLPVRPPTSSSHNPEAVTDMTQDALVMPLLPPLAIHTSPPSEETQRELHRAAELHHLGSDLRTDPPLALEHLQEGLAVLARLLSPFHLDLLATACALQNVAIELQQWQLAATCGVHVASVYRTIYPALHPMIGLQLHRTADVHAMFDPVAARRLYAAALPSLTAAFGPDHPFVAMAREHC